MTIADERKKPGRIPFQYVEIDLDSCTEEFGVSPCLATGMKCYKTRATCGYAAAYATEQKTYRFHMNESTAPAGFASIPCVESISTAPTKITPTKGLGYRAKLTVKMSDFKHHDRGVDPYLSTRSYDPMEQGTYFGRFRARNPYYKGRVIRVYSGYLVDSSVIGATRTGLDTRVTDAADTRVTDAADIRVTPAEGLAVINRGLVYDAANFEMRTYFIDKFYADSDGNVTVTAKDILSKTDADKAQAPIASSGTLSVALTAVATSLVLQTGEGADYNDPAVTGVSEHIAIGDEIIKYTGISTDTLTGLTRGVYSTAATHAIDDSVQQCLTYESINCTDVAADLLENFANIDASYIPTAKWATEETEWLSAFNVTTIIPKPIGVNQLISELAEQSLFNIWWDERLQEITLKAFAPYTSDTAVDDSSTFTKMKVMDKPEDRISQLWVSYGLLDHKNDDKPESYRYTLVYADTESESATKNNERKIKKVYSRWYRTSAPMIQFSSRVSKWLSENPRFAEFSTDAKDGELWTGDPIDVTTSQIQSADGASNPVEMFIVEAVEEKDGSFTFKAMNSPFFGRYARIMANTAPIYTSATAEEKLTGGWIASTGTGFADGGEAYKIA